MISPVSITKNYILQPGLLEKHRKTLEWMSAVLLWKRELAFFQKLLDQYAPKFTDVEDKKKIDHFQNILIYYNAEVTGELRRKLIDHETRLATMLETMDESRTDYYKEHDGVMQDLEAFSRSFITYKEDLFHFIEKAMDK
ncbi:MAG TPA: hypothetical protein VD816_05060 [Ohtaekwangia sp.]|nr:hypothetical protein [Ohtaekwangia sp.]